ncbi:Tubulin--tyrosine ligase [Balamuthia mandrillaris]
MEGHLCEVVVERDGSGQTATPSPPPPLKATLSDLTNNFTAPITFGCASSCTFRLRPTTGALERHAELRIERGKAVLYNLDSESRFVRVNKDAVSYHQPRSLEDGDTILLANGELCLQFGLPLDPPSSSSSPSLPSSYSSKLLSSSSSSSNKENQQPQKNTTNPSFASSLSFSSSSASCNGGNKGKIQRREHQHSSPDHSRRTTRVSSFTTCSSFEEEIDHNSHSGAMNGLLLPFCGKKEQQHKASLPSLLPPTAGRGPQTRDIGEMDPKQLMIMEEQQQDEQWDRASSALAAMASYKARSPSTPSPSSALQQLEDHEEQDDEEEHDDDGEEYEEAEHSSTSTLRSVRIEDNEHYSDYYDENDEIGEEVDEEDKAWIRTKTSTTINNGSNEKSDVGPPFTTFHIGVSDILREGMTGEFSIVRDPKSGALNFVLKIPTAFGYGSPASSNNLHYHNSRKVSHSFSDNKEDQETSVMPSVDEMKCTEQHQVTNVPTKGNSDETATTTTTSSSLTPRRSKRLRSSTLTTSTTNSTKHDMPSTKKTRPNNSASKKNATMKMTESPDAVSVPDSPTNARRPFKKRSTVRRGTHLRKDATKEQQEREEVEEGEEEELLSNEVNEVSEEEEEGDGEERKNTIRTRRRSDASDTQEQSWMPTERKTKSVDRKGTLLWSAERVLREEGRPMKAPEIVEVGRRKGYIDTDSKRAANSLVGRFSTSIRQDPNSPFVRLSPATYGLKEHMEFYRLVRQGASSPN